MALSPVSSGSGYPQALNYGGDSTVGAVAVSNVQIAVLGYQVTSTAATDVAGFVVHQNFDSLLRVESSLNIENGTSGSTITFELQYTDANTGNPVTTYLHAGSTTLDAAASVDNGVYLCTPVLIPAQAGSAVTLTYTDASGTPSDWVSVTISTIA